MRWRRRRLRRTDEEEDGRGLRRKNTQGSVGLRRKTWVKENDWGEED